MCEACAEHTPERRAYFGDPNVHTGFSMNAHARDLPLMAGVAYRFATGEEIDLPVSGLRAPGTEERPGGQLQRIRFVKGWAGSDDLYHQRVVESPSCGWSARQCLTVPGAEGPNGCSDPRVPKRIQERARTSPPGYARPAAPEAS